MQNAQELHANNQNQQQKQIKSGKYEFVIQGIITTDSNGYMLKTSNGNTYKKLRLILIDGEENHTVYKFIFGSQDIKEIVLAIANPALTHVFHQQSKDFELENLVGESGWLLMGKRQNKKDGLMYSQVECFLKPKLSGSYPIKQIETPVQTKINENIINNELEDGVPF